MRLCSNVLGKFSIRKRLLVWDSYEAHLTDDVKKTPTISKLKLLSHLVAVPSTCEHQMRFRKDLPKTESKNGMTIGWLMQNMNIRLEETENQFQFQ